MKLVLASGSAVRATLLRNAGLDFAVIRPDVDETVIKQAGERAGKTVEAVAADLAAAKAAVVAAQAPDAIVIAADQMMECDGAWFDKPADLAEARARLLDLAGRAHRLITAVDMRRGERVLCRHTAIATLTMRPFGEAFVDHYLGLAGDAVCQSVGAYQLEGPGALLFDRVEGDFFTILGLPLLTVLATLRQEGAIPA
ncbi:MAG: Maf family protein [Alphaproteobacteria bacterium]|nr:Maf family protein [Alphaproteobacteria bacterium]MCB9927949.1 Maf family protein [Alphaproteobacteria bacterium]